MTEGTINFFSEACNYKVNRRKLLRAWIRKAIAMEGGSPGVINLVFCTDEYLLALNRQYLKHDTLTDIITFPFSDYPGEVCGDIFMSIERIKENSKTFKVKVHQEVERIIIHGILHLLGHKDKSLEEGVKMRRMEDLYLEVLQKMI